MTRSASWWSERLAGERAAWGFHPRVSDIGWWTDEARSARTQGEVARMLAHPASEVRRSAATNRRATTEMLQAALGVDPENDGVYANPNCPLPLIDHEHVHDHVPTTCWSAVASNPACPPHVLDQFIFSDTTRTALAVASNPSCPPGLLARIGRLGDGWSESSRVWRALAQNPNTPAETLDDLLASGRVDGYLAAENPNASWDLLNTVAGQSNEHERRRVAANPQCPPDVFARLVGDKRTAVRVAACRNTRLSREYLSRLAADSSQQVRHSVLSHPDCPDAVVVHIAATDRSEKTRQRAQVIVETRGLWIDAGNLPCLEGDPT